MSMKQSVSFSKQLQEDMRLIDLQKGVKPRVFMDRVVAMVERAIQERKKNAMDSIRIAYIIGKMSDTQYKKLMNGKVPASLIKRRMQHKKDSLYYLKNTREGLFRNSSSVKKY